jgi:DNA-binding protein H-NS
MARPSKLSSMPIEALIKMRDDINAVLSRKADELQSQIARLNGGTTISPMPRRRGSTLAGRKVAPKYRGPNGELWSGRGARPRWLVPLLKKGKKLDSFLIK